MQVVWAEGSGLFSLGDDRKILKWSVNGEFEGEFATLDVYPTCISARNDGTKTLLVVGTSEVIHKLLIPLI